MRASVFLTREPTKPESRLSSEQGLASAVNLAVVDRELTQKPWISTPLLADLFVAEVSSV